MFTAATKAQERENLILSCRNPYLFVFSHANFDLSRNMKTGTSVVRTFGRFDRFSDDPS